ncbi:MAG: hypothetical protein LBG67_03215, partial [Campylobacteraceae bacterium]|nr:hypothetical protein [Campylobacteraceae bacterium]
MDILRFILLIPIYLIKAFGKALNFVIRAFLFVLKPIIGKIEWSIPFWVEPTKKFLDRLSELIKKYVLQVWLAVIIIIIGIIGYNYYQAWKNNQPKPIEVAPTEYVYAGGSLYEPTTRDYTRAEDNASRYYFTIYFDDSVAPVDISSEQRENVTKGISISPNVKGVWSWVSEREIKFTPENMWDIGKTYKVTIESEKLLANHIILDNKEYSFTIPPFSYNIVESELYQNPLDPMDKNAMFRVNFSDPVNIESFEKNLKMALMENIPSDTPSKNYEAAKKRVEKNAKNSNFVVKYDDKKITAWVRSEKVSLPEVESSMILSIDKGVRADGTKEETTSLASKSQFIASVYTNVVKGASLEVVEKEDSSLQQALVINLIDGINVDKFSQEVKAWVLPKDKPATKNASEIKNRSWSLDYDDIDHDILSKSKPLNLAADTAEEENQKLVSFKYNSEPFKYIYVEIGKNIQTIGGYKAKNVSKYILRVP